MCLSWVHKLIDISYSFKIYNTCSKRTINHRLSELRVIHKITFIYLQSFFFFYNNYTCPSIVRNKKYQYLLLLLLLLWRYYDILRNSVYFFHSKILMIYYFIIRFEYYKLYFIRNSVFYKLNSKFFS